LKERVIAYIDGFNLYFGLLEANLEYYKWLDLHGLISNIMKHNQELVGIKYFTSRVNNNPNKLQKQNTYLEALETTGIDLFYGRYQLSEIDCHRCGHVWADYNEKMTDVQIATHMMMDAYKDNYDTAMLISGDSDLVPPIRAIHEEFSKKRVFVLFPPKRHNQSVALSAKGSMTIGKKKIKDNQFPEEVEKNDGYVLKRPNEWTEKTNVDKLKINGSLKDVLKASALSSKEGKKK
jgi:uncharacterized LabA/DUF88 family protein